jgi:hypothetical protein
VTRCTPVVCKTAILMLAKKLIKSWVSRRIG